MINFVNNILEEIRDIYYIISKQTDKLENLEGPEITEIRDEYRKVEIETATPALEEARNQYNSLQERFHNLDTKFRFL